MCGNRRWPPQALVSTNHDRAAPKGLGAVKAAGNYAADLSPVHGAHAQGYNTTLYLDAKERKYVEEFSVCNFVGITKDETCDIMRSLAFGLGLVSLCWQAARAAKNSDSNGDQCKYLTMLYVDWAGESNNSRPFVRLLSPTDDWTLFCCWSFPLSLSLSVSVSVSVSVSLCRRRERDTCSRRMRRVVNKEVASCHGRTGAISRRSQTRSCSPRQILCCNSWPEIGG